MGEIFRDKKVLVISPHPDDETIGCGGTILRIKAMGGEASVLVVSLGDLLQYGGVFPDKQQKGPELQIVSSKETRENAGHPPANPGPSEEGGGAPLLISGETREKEFLAAMEVLGVSRRHVLHRESHLHLRLDTIPQRELIADLECNTPLSVQNLRPDIVFLPSPSFNQDHRAVFRAGVATLRPGNPARHEVPVVLVYDSPVTSWGKEFPHLVFTDITKAIEEKIEAFSCYRSQIRSEPSFLTPEAIADRARVTGREAGVQYAEGFYPLRMLLK